MSQTDSEPQTVDPAAQRAAVNLHNFILRQYGYNSYGVPNPNVTLRSNYISALRKPRKNAFVECSVSFANQVHREDSIVSPQDFKLLHRNGCITGTTNISLIIRPLAKLLPQAVLDRPALPYPKDFTLPQREEVPTASAAAAETVTQPETYSAESLAAAALALHNFIIGTYGVSEDCHRFQHAILHKQYSDTIKSPHANSKLRVSYSFSTQVQTGAACLSKQQLLVLSGIGALREGFINVHTLARYLPPEVLAHPDKTFGIQKLPAPEPEPEPEITPVVIKAAAELHRVIMEGPGTGAKYSLNSKYSQALREHLQAPGDKKVVGISNSSINMFRNHIPDASLRALIEAHILSKLMVSVDIVQMAKALPPATLHAYRGAGQGQGIDALPGR